MTLIRTVVPELLDDLDMQDPRAQRSRRDLRRLHRIMRTETILLDALRKISWQRSVSSSSPRLQVLEIGAGDGSLMLGVARALQGLWPAVSLTLLDQHNLLETTTEQGYANAGWRVSAQVCDVLDWAKPEFMAQLISGTAHWDLIVSNLFLHHFDDPQLVLLLDAVAARSNHFIACEPNRSWFALAGSHLVGAVGANAVTRQDAVLSVRAGFRNRELCTLWPVGEDDWVLEEYPAGLFSHCFYAARTRGLRADARS
ncbi:methyltransferase domain-containing protein [Pusillimonas sp. ANT_WB101]|uniref:methyltransferase domain-containing protein n=1 Tax=Pusillimonas sp. ANT_WB101 TaxID=2597356 RepID=UPI0011EBDFBC|nr:methyltransferase domain-containing protein [Pusillimonas sp. ANT_WB101]KAA0911184.1 methyltransferase domain-containing protein [Pusillimonas sp. ANT_WB101]